MRWTTLARLATVWLAFVGIGLGGPLPVAACSCEIDPLTNQLYFPDVDLIFTAKVVGDAEPTSIDLGNGSSWPMSRYRVRVDRYFKGRLGRNIDVLTETPSSSCGVELDRGTSYLVYADLREDGTPEVSF